MHFTTPRRNQGQIVEVSYAVHKEGLIESVYDSSDRTCSYGIAKWTKKLDDWFEEYGLDSPPPASTIFKKIPKPWRYGISENHGSDEESAPATRTLWTQDIGGVLPRY